MRSAAKISSKTCKQAPLPFSCGHVNQRLTGKVDIRLPGRGISTPHSAKVGLRRSSRLLGGFGPLGCQSRTLAGRLRTHSRVKAAEKDPAKKSRSAANRGGGRISGNARHRSIKHGCDRVWPSVVDRFPANISHRRQSRPLAFRQKSSQPFKLLLLRWEAVSDQTQWGVL